MTSDELFIQAGRAKSLPRILEMGTLQSVPGRSTMVGKDWFPHYGQILGTDIESGPDVDVVADAHHLYSHIFLSGGCVETSKFDIIISRSVFEHLRKPWLVSKELHKCLNKDGLIYIQTHHTFPIHAYPSDYFRFTTEGLISIFEYHFDIISTDYKFPARIRAVETPGIEDCPAWLNVNLFGIKKDI